MLKSTALLLPLLLLSSFVSADQVKCEFPKLDEYRTLEFDSKNKKAILTGRFTSSVIYGKITGVTDFTYQRQYHLDFPTTYGIHEGLETKKLVLTNVVTAAGKWRIHSATVLKEKGELILREVREVFPQCYWWAM